MAKVRIAGFGSAFELENELVGIGTDNPTNTLQVLGDIKSSNTKVIGISTLTTYQGFVDTKAAISGAAGSKSGAISGEIIIEGTVSVSSGTTFTSGPKNLTVTDSFTLPGISEDKPSVGTTRFNENLGSLEFYTGVEWRAVNSIVDGGGGAGAMGSRGRGCFAGGRNAGSTNQASIEFIEITTTGNSTRFGDLATARMWPGGCGSATRGIFGSGSPSTNIDYITIASAGNGITFGTCSQSGGAGACSSSTRALFGGGYSGTANAIEFIEIMTLGNAVDFGDIITRSSAQYMSACSSPTRGFFMGSGDGGTYSALIDSVQFGAKGNTTRFGELSQARGQSASFSNATRGVQACGQAVSTPAYHISNTIDYITLASTGNAIDFGDAPTRLAQIKTGAASQTRGCFAGGTTDGSNTLNTINYIQFSTTGNATEFGELSNDGRRNGVAGLSDSHGGLGGY